MTGSAERLRVVHLVLSLDVGGLEMVVLDLVRLADRATFEPRVLCLGEVGFLAPRFEAIGVPVESLGVARPGLSRTLPRLARRLRELRPKVVHTHNMAPHFQGALASWAAGVPVLVHTKHGRNYPTHRPTVLANRLASFLTDRVVAVSQDAGAVAREIERVPARKVEVIYNGVDLGRFPPPASRHPGGMRAITVARLHPIKDQATMLRAARLVADAEPGFGLDLVGDGPARPELEALRDELGLRDQVRFLGYQADVGRFLADADLFLLSSVSEGISLTLLEAMAAGLPVVASDVGGNPEVVAAGETGLLAPVGSPEALARAILEILRDPGRAARMGQAGRRRVEEVFDLPRVVSRYEQLYLSLLGASRAGVPARPEAPVPAGAGAGAEVVAPACDR